MSAREWKPGDVALLTFNDGSTAVGARREAGAWGHSGGFGNGSAYDLIGGFTARPLVVIDAEDREQVERLRDLWDAMHEQQEGHPPSLHKRVARANCLQGALREFANPKPPEPAEPTGLGAVVEDASGATWVRVHRQAINAWTRAGYGDLASYADLAAVTVLSEGMES